MTVISQESWTPVVVQLPISHQTEDFVDKQIILPH